MAIYTWYMPGVYPSVWAEHIPAIYTEVCPYRLVADIHKLPQEQEHIFDLSRKPKNQPPPNTNTIKKKTPPCPHILSWYRGAKKRPRRKKVLSNIYQAHTWHILLLNIGDQYVIGIYPVKNWVEQHSPG